jgi:hypothetical protein
MGDTGGRTLTTSGDWWYYKKIVFNNALVSENLVNFPVLINLTRAGSELWSHVGSSYNDLRFLDSDGTTDLHFEVEYWNYASQEALVWVKVPTIDANSATDFIYLYYGNPSPPPSAYLNSPQTWDSNYVLVVHLSETSGTRHDSTANNNDGTPYGSLAKAASGKIDGADDFNGVDDALNVTHSSSLNYGDVVTIEAWFRPNSVSTNVGGIDKGSGAIYLLGNNTAGQYGKIRLGRSSSGTIIASATALSDNCWTYVVGMKNGNDARIYLNGTLDAQTNTPPYNGVNNTNNLIIGQRPSNPTEYINSVVDEIRISNVARSAGWTKAQYLSMTDGYVTFEAEVFVIPEYWLGALLGLVACFAAFGLFTRFKRIKAKNFSQRNLGV